MRSKAEILAEVQDAVAGGRREIQLLGQIVNHYQAPDDPDCDFAGAARGGERRRRRRADPVRQPAPAARLRAPGRGDSRPAAGLQARAPAGSVRVHAGSCRRCGGGTRARTTWTSSTGSAQAVPGLAISTDMIVGFPGETEDDFEETLSLTERVGFSSMFSFKYSERPNTLAAKRLKDDVPEEVKGRRLTELQELQKQIQWDLHKGAVGRVFEVLVDSRSRRHAERTGRANDRERGGESPGRAGLGGADDPRSGSSGPGRTACGARRRTTQPLTSREHARTLYGRGRREGANLGRPRRVKMQVEMTIKGLMVDPITHMPIIILRDHGRPAGAADLGGHLRGQRHRPADGEHLDAAADDARPAAATSSRTWAERSRRS